MWETWPPVGIRCVTFPPMRIDDQELVRPLGRHQQAAVPKGVEAMRARPAPMSTRADDLSGREVDQQNQVPRGSRLP